MRYAHATMEKKRWYIEILNMDTKPQMATGPAQGNEEAISG
ncbi:MAG: hypothetical protein ABID32_01055 [Candidatus Omnitrophota bacterium]